VHFTVSLVHLHNKACIQLLFFHSTVHEWSEFPVVLICWICFVVKNVNFVNGVCASATRIRDMFLDMEYSPIASC
jgi:hypothetical protein